MLTDLRHAGLKKALIWSAEFNIGSSTENPIEWAKFMGLPEGFDHFNIGRHVAAAGKSINQALGEDFIAQHFPKWVDNPRYSTF